MVPVVELRPKTPTVLPPHFFPPLPPLTAARDFAGRERIRDGCRCLEPDEPAAATV